MHSIGADDPVPIMYTLCFVNDALTGTKKYLASVPRYIGRPVDPGSSVGTSKPSDTLGREFDPGKRDFSH